MSNRTDIHRPTTLVTEDYEFVAAFDNQERMIGRPESYLAWRGELVGRVIETNADRADHQCHHCGAHIRYFAILLHTPTGEHIAVGDTCMDNRFSIATVEFQKLRKAAELDRQAQRIVKACQEFAELHPEIAFLLGELPDYTPSFIHSIKGSFRKYGNLSDRQISTVVRVMAEAKAKAEAPVVVEETAPVIEGRIVITGEVLTTKWQDSDFGGSLKMLVKDDRNFKVWGSVPSSLNVDKGDRISFTATVTASDRDESFGFFKRPSKAAVLEVAA